MLPFSGQLPVAQPLKFGDPAAFDLRWRRLVAPTVEPISLAEAKAHAKILQPDGDATLMRYIRAAREAAEQAENRGLLTQTWQASLRRFADSIWLPRADPLQNDPLATPSTAPIVQYYDNVAGTLQTLDPSFYVVDLLSRPGRILRAPNKVWPIVQTDRLAGAVLITYTIGWLTPEDVPERTKQGIRMYLTYLDADPDGMDMNGQHARDSALACWDDHVETIYPAVAVVGGGIGSQGGLVTRLGLGVGRYDKYVSLSRAPRTPDDSDGLFEPLTPPNAWASIRPMLAATDGRTIEAQVEMRWHPQVTLDTRIVFVDPARPPERQAREFFVRGVENIDEANQILRLICEEITP